MRRPPNIAVLGCGTIVRRAHLPGLLANGQAKVPVIYGPDTPNSREVAKTFGIARLVHSLEQVFTTPDLDAVVIALPNHEHAPAAFAAIAAGLPMLLEKPIAPTIGAAREIVGRAERAGIRVVMSLPQRQRPSLIRLRHLVQSGALGQIQSIDIKMVRRAGIPGYGGWFTHRALAGGGVLTDLGPHVIDTALWLAGCSEVAKVEGRLWSTHGPRGRGLGDWGARRALPEAGEAAFDVEDRVWLALQLTSRTQVTCECAWAVYGGDENRIRVVGDRGGADYWPECYGTASPLRIHGDQSDGQPAEAAGEPMPADHDDLDPAWARVDTIFVEDLWQPQSRLVEAAEALVSAELIQRIYGDLREGLVD